MKVKTLNAFTILLFFYFSMTDSEIDFKIIKTRKTSIFENEIDFLQKKGGVLLGSIQILQHYLDYKKKNSKVDMDDINNLKEMIMKFLHILSLIDIYEYFQSKNQTITDVNSFLFMVDNCYSVRINKFIKDLKI